MRLMAKAGTKSDLDQGQILIGQHGLGAFDAIIDQVLMRRRTGCTFKFARKVKRADAGHTGQLGQAKISFVIVGDEIGNAL